MSGEYVRLLAEEINYGEKNLLQAQLSLITLIKRYKSYKLLRNEEFLLKIYLKTKIDEINNNLTVLEKLLPKVSAQKEEQQDFPEAKKDKDRLDLEAEIDHIRAKLARLQ